MVLAAKGEFFALMSQTRKKLSFVLLPALSAVFPSPLVVVAVCVYFAVFAWAGLVLVVL